MKTKFTCELCGFTNEDAAKVATHEKDHLTISDFVMTKVDGYHRDVNVPPLKMYVQWTRDDGRAVASEYQRSFFGDPR